MSAQLGERLRKETRQLHTQAERSAFMGQLLRGEMSRSAYVALLRHLLALYAALEPALKRHASHPALSGFDFQALARAQSLVDDLSSLDVPGAGATADGVVPSCRIYVDRLAAIDASHPELLLAHAYVRYLGDLSGGQALGRIVAKSFSLPPGAGTAFYAFGSAEQVAALAAGFRRGLELATVDDDAIVAEARQAFEWHRSLFDELARAHGIAGAASDEDR